MGPPKGVGPKKKFRLSPPSLRPCLLVCIACPDAAVTGKADDQTLKFDKPPIERLNHRARKIEEKLRGNLAPFSQFWPPSLTTMPNTSQT